MKKIIFGLIAFGIVCFAATGILIYKHNEEIMTKDNNQENVSKSGDNAKENNHENKSGDNVKEDDHQNKSGDNTEEQVKEKTLDLNGTYNENDIIINENIENRNGVEIKIPQISGLKNKDIETKVNNSIKEKIYSSLKEYSDIEYMSFYTSANFSNVISIICTCGLKDDWKEICLNYELINGEELKLYDLLSKNADIYTIVRKAFYRDAARSAISYENIEEPKYDPITNTWYTYQYVWNDATNSYEETKVEFVIDEDEIAKNIENFMNSSRKEFFFTPQMIYLKNGNYSVDFSDIADSIVIYDKYLTEESLYEVDNIGLKNLFTCASSCGEYVQYQDYNMYGDNLFYDIVIAKGGFALNRINEQNLKETIYELQKTKAYEKLNEYKEIAKQNPDEFYVVIIRPVVHTLDFPDDMDNTFFIEVHLQTKVDENKKSKEENLKEIKNEYRYPNIAFYGSAGDYYYTENIKNYSTEKEWLELSTLQKIDIDKYYNENSEYKNFINQAIKNKLSKDSIPFEELEIEKISYDLEKYQMNVNFKENAYGLEETKIYFYYR